MNPFRNFRLLDGLGLKDLGCLIQCATNAHYKAGETLVEEGDKADGLFLIRKGSLALHTASPFWRKEVFRTVDAGEVIGCPWFSARLWPFTAYALEPTDVVIIDAARVRAMVGQFPDFGLHLAKRLERLEPNWVQTKPERPRWRSRLSELSECPTEGVVSL